jgi:23S rRNA maturation-related 3'-5' exoribonuclease YhaM
MKTKIENLLISTKREGIENLCRHMETIGFYTAPASTLNHGCRVEGLAIHSNDVCTFGIHHLAGLMSTENINMVSWVISSLLHDLGKAAYRDKKQYVPNILQSGKVSTAKPYEVNKDRLQVPHEVVSLQIASKFIELTDEEEFAILYHNGLYTQLGKEVNGKERPLQLMLHFADMYCSRFIEKVGV